VNPLSDPSVQQTLTGVFRHAVPEIALLGTACVVFLGGCLVRGRGLWFAVSLAGVLLAIILAAAVRTDAPPTPALAAAVGGAAAAAAPPASVPTVAPIISDGTAAFVRWVALIAAALYLLVGWGEVTGENAAEYFGCLLTAAAGTALVGRANDLITLFLALELLSIPTYVLLYIPAQHRANQEATAKYFLLSVMSSAVLLFGFSYLYGLTGTTNITAILDTLTKANAERLSPMALLAIVLVIAAMGFRITAVPFHFYAPDVYDGAPAGVVSQLAFLPKVAGFVALARLLGLLADPRHLPFDASSQVPLLLWILAVVTMTLGNVLALLQDNIRRMLAYSSVAHGGYMLMGLVVAGAVPDAKAAMTIGGFDAVLVYLVAYGMMTVGAFAVVLYLGTPERAVESVDDLAGAGAAHPVSAAAMAVFLLSLIGMPLTAGFVGKFLLFVGTFSAPADTPTMRHLYQILAAVAAVNAAVGAYYYLRVVGVMYLRTPIRPAATSRAYPVVFAAVLLAAATLVFGFYPNPLVKAAKTAAPIPPPAKGQAEPSRTGTPPVAGLGTP
jgi:NADH-quinone oxidoreductase subunit N